jgi:hypothetical protein
LQCSAVQCSTTILLAETGVELRFQETYLDGLESFKRDPTSLRAGLLTAACGRLLT